MEPAAQLSLWVRGSSIHNRQPDECCPDFSCCHPDLQADPEVRQKYLRADVRERNAMRLAFLATALSIEGNRARISMHEDTRAPMSAACFLCKSRRAMDWPKARVEEAHDRESHIEHRCSSCNIRFTCANSTEHVGRFHFLCLDCLTAKRALR